MPAVPRPLPRRHHFLHRLPEPALYAHEAHRREHGACLGCSKRKAQCQQGKMGCFDYRNTFQRRRTRNALHARPQAALLPQQHQPQEGAAGAAGTHRTLPGRK